MAKQQNQLYISSMKSMVIALLFITACSHKEEPVNENTAPKGYVLPVSVNVTREDNATRATYNDETKKLSFSDGDQLFIEGYIYDPDLAFAGKLTWQSEGTFSGELGLSSAYEGTFDELLTEAGAGGLNELKATLLPDGHEAYQFMQIYNYMSGEAYDDYLIPDYQKAVAADKAAAVEQFSLEQAFTYSGGFALTPQNAIVCFTYKDEDVAEGTSCKPALDGGIYFTYGGDVEMEFGTGGVVTFAIGVNGSISTEYPDISWSLTDSSGSTSINAVIGVKPLLPGHIYIWSNL